MIEQNTLWKGKQLCVEICVWIISGQLESQVQHCLQVMWMCMVVIFLWYRWGKWGNKNKSHPFWCYSNCGEDLISAEKCKINRNVHYSLQISSWNVDIELDLGNFQFLFLRFPRIEKKIINDITANLSFYISHDFQPLDMIHLLFHSFSLNGLKSLPSISLTGLLWFFSDKFDLRVASCSQSSWPEPFFI